MDLFIYLRNGLIAPITGCTAIASIDDVGTSVATTATSTSGTQLLTVASNTGIVSGMRVYGKDIRPLTTVVGVSGSTLVIISAPVTGTLTAANVAFVGPSAADMKLLAQNSGVYRDLFTATVDFAMESNAGSTLAGAPVAMDGYGVWVDQPVPDYVAAGNGTGIQISGDLKAAVSDDIAHVAPRRLSYVEALWSFSCTVDSETLAMSFLKREVHGWGNVQPDV